MWEIYEFVEDNKTHMIVGDILHKKVLIWSINFWFLFL